MRRRRVPARRCAGESVGRQREAASSGACGRASRRRSPAGARAAARAGQRGVDRDAARGSVTTSTPASMASRAARWRGDGRGGRAGWWMATIASRPRRATRSRRTRQSRTARAPCRANGPGRTGCERGRWPAADDDRERALVELQVRALARPAVVRDAVVQSRRSGARSRAARADAGCAGRRGSGSQRPPDHLVVDQDLDLSVSSGFSGSRAQPDTCRPARVSVPDGGDGEIRGRERQCATGRRAVRV